MFMDFFFFFLRTTNLVRGNNPFPRKLGSYQSFVLLCSVFSCGYCDNRTEWHPENKGNYSSLEEGKIKQDW